MPEREFTIHRVFDAPRDLVFQAWTDPAHLAGWYGPVGCTAPRESIRMDLRPGGSWSALMVNDENGEQYPTGGVYREVNAPERLVFTWGDPADDRESVITITLAEVDGKTSMTFHQAGFVEERQREMVNSGWSSAFEKLTEYVERTR
jgi:uncharacterized protein YndB with AHSA1/START domain